MAMEERSYYTKLCSAVIAKLTSVKHRDYDYDVATEAGSTRVFQNVVGPDTQAVSVGGKKQWLLFFYLLFKFCYFASIAMTR